MRNPWALGACFRAAAIARTTRLPSVRVCWLLDGLLIAWRWFTYRQPGGVGHVVLYVDTDDGAFIPQRARWPVSPMMLDYEWEAMLCGGEWRELRGWS